MKAITSQTVTATFPSELWSKLFDELLSRLPLSLTTAASRFGLPADQSAVIDCSLRSCNIIFEIVVSQLKRLKASSDFQPNWLRYINVLAQNAVLAHGTDMHDEMLEMVTALMRLLKAPTIPVQNAPATNIQVTNPASSSAFKLFMLWSTPQPPTTDPVDEVESYPPDLSQSAVGEEDDGELLILSWKSVCCTYSAFQANLRAKYPQLVRDLEKYAEVVEKRVASAVKVINVSNSATPVVAIDDSRDLEFGDQSFNVQILIDTEVGDGIESGHPNATTRPINMRVIDSRTHIV